MKNLRWVLLFITNSVLMLTILVHPVQSNVPGSASTKFRRIGFVIKHNDAKAEKLAIVLGRLALKEGCHIFVADESSTVQEQLCKTIAEPLRSMVQLVRKDQLPESTDLIVVVGGDGTLLSIARLMIKKSVPLMGINLGHLGFLAAVSESEAVTTLDAVLKGKETNISMRALCDVSLYRKDRPLFQGLALNDAVVTKGAISRVIGLEVSINGQKAYDVRGDGLIISTPTGSTAYSLSAGGPIVFPELAATVITPICSHTLTQRPLVVPDTCEIKLLLTHKPGHVYLTLDGQDAVDMQEGDIVTIKRFKNTVQLIEPFTQDYFALLRDKLHFASTC